MARQESDREDLMREATALVRRAELTYPGRAEAENVIAGFRRDGRLSLYFGADPVYQFDEGHRLRRAYVDGFLYRTQGGTLARLTRIRTPEVTHLLRHDLDPTELAEFRESARKTLAELQEALISEKVRVLTQVPRDGSILEEIQTALAEVLGHDLPLAPPIPGKR